MTLWWQTRIMPKACRQDDFANAAGAIVAFLSAVTVLQCAVKVLLFSARPCGLLSCCSDQALHHLRKANGKTEYNVVPCSTWKEEKGSAPDLQSLCESSAPHSERSRDPLLGAFIHWLPLR